MGPDTESLRSDYRHRSCGTNRACESWHLNESPARLRAMNAFGQTICLNLIVKNEAPVICRCLDSVRPVIDSWVIVDTGSSDGTQEIIRGRLADLPGELHERPWKNFAHNRSEGLALARGRGDYVLLIDADECLDISAGFEMPQLVSDSYKIQVRYGDWSYPRKQLLRNALPWRFEGVVHEYAVCEQATTEEFLPGVQTIARHDGARGCNPETYHRDARQLEKALLEEPHNARYVFYLAQSYRDAGEYKSALKNYERRIAMGGWKEEVWYSLYQIGQIKQLMGAAWPEVLESYLAAWQFQPDRAGPLFRIAMRYQAEKLYDLSHLFLSRAMQIPAPGPDRLFVERTLYEYRLALEYAVACFYVGKHEEAIATNNRLLESGMLPPELVSQIVLNRQFSLDRIQIVMEA
jgi:glycosyltransferase involved in cell wall biosynthesis